MDNKSTTAKDAAGKAAQVSGKKKGNGSDALTIETAVAKSKRSPAKNLLTQSAQATVTAPTGSSGGFTQDDIALRAYLLSERRREHGLDGDQHQDWLEAERQLLAESRTHSKARKPRR